MFDENEEYSVINFTKREREGDQETGDEGRVNYENLELESGSDTNENNSPVYIQSAIPTQPQREKDRPDIQMFKKRKIKQLTSEQFMEPDTHYTHKAPTQSQTPHTKPVPANTQVDTQQFNTTNPEDPGVATVPLGDHHNHPPSLIPILLPAAQN